MRSDGGCLVVVLRVGRTLGREDLVQLELATKLSQ